MTATAIDHIFTNSFIDRNFKTAIIKTDVSDHFPICFIIPSLKHQTENETTCICKRIINNGSIELFKHRLFESNWHEVEVYENLDEVYKTFLHRFLAIYGNFFPKKKLKAKTQDIQIPWVTKEIQKSSKYNRLYETFWKKEIEEMNLNMKIVKRYLK